MNPQGTSDSCSAPTTGATLTSVNLFQVGGTNQFTGTFSEDGPSGNPDSITRYFRCNLMTNAPLDSLSNGTCFASSDVPIPQTQLEPVYNTLNRFYDVTIGISRPGNMWPTTINYDFSVDVTFE